MIDYATEMRQTFIQGGHAAKLAYAIRWMRTRGLYCLDRNSKAYTPVYGSPMPFKGASHDPLAT
jgi:hypothetical protein